MYKCFPFDDSATPMSWKNRIPPHRRNINYKFISATYGLAAFAFYGTEYSIYSEILVYPIRKTSLFTPQIFIIGSVLLGPLAKMATH